jgi:hypothetical protein
MPDSSGITTENEIAEIVLRIFVTRSRGTASYRELVSEIPKLMNLTAKDRELSLTRPDEEVWEQRVRNIRSHRKSEGNYINDGYLAAIPRGLEITELGRKKAS